MAEKIFLSWEEVRTLIKRRIPQGLRVHGVPRGGAIVAEIYGGNVPVHEAQALVDDLVDSGVTRDRWSKKYPNKPMHVLIDKQEDEAFKNKWVVFPWEVTEEGDKSISENVVRVLEYLGEDAGREGLQETPARYIKFLEEFTSPEDFKMTTFDGESYDEMVVQSGIPFFSLCEHHMVPFFGTAAVAYIPGKKIVGLSKLARTVEWFSRRLQNQERITQQIAHKIQETLSPLGVAVVIRARHLCMEMRGVKKHDTWTTTSKLMGRFKESAEARAEFFKIIEGDMR